MGHSIDLIASDDHRLSAYVADPASRARGGILVIQEIFGITHHIRDVVDQYAEAGYRAIAPALFDRSQRGVDVPYSDVQQAMGYMKAAQLDKVMLDLEAAVLQVRPTGKVGVVGYCWGGMLSFLAAVRLPVAAAVAYYGGGIDQHLTEKPRVPVMLHFGERDTHIPLPVVREIQASYPQGLYHLYPAEHGFNCTDRPSFEPRSAELALQRSLEFFREHVG